MLRNYFGISDVPYSAHCAHIYYFIVLIHQPYDQTLRDCHTLVSVNTLVICCDISIAQIYYLGPHILFTHVHSVSGGLCISALIFMFSFMKLPLEMLIISPSIVGIKGGIVSSKAIQNNMRMLMVSHYLMPIAEHFPYSLHNLFVYC